jgi:ribosome production factor 2
LIKTENKAPDVELDEMGPSMDLTMRRNKISSDDLYKKSKKQPKEITVLFLILNFYFL